MDCSHKRAVLKWEDLSKKKNKPKPNQNKTLKQFNIWRDYIGFHRGVVRKFALSNKPLGSIRGVFGQTTLILTGNRCRRVQHIAGQTKLLSFCWNLPKSGVKILQHNATLWVWLQLCGARTGRHSSSEMFCCPDALDTTFPFLVEFGKSTNRSMVYAQNVLAVVTNSALLKYKSFYGFLFCTLEQVRDPLCVYPPLKCTCMNFPRASSLILIFISKNLTPVMKSPPSFPVIVGEGLD